MQVISSLLKLQSHQIKNEQDKAYFKDSHNRVKTMSLIHEKLYLSDNLEKIDFKEYIISLTTHLYSSYSINPSDVKLKVDLQNITLDINKAIPCGLLINELVSNSIKHGFPGGLKGEIIVSLKTEGNKTILTAGNNGVPFPDNIDFDNAETLGLRLIKALTEQLHGSLKLDRRNGTKFEVVFQI
jgi:two-component sensor histidine kinase